MTALVRATLFSCAVACLVPLARGQGVGVEGTAPKDPVKPSTRRMAERLVEHEKSVDVDDCAFMSAERVLSIRAKLERQAGTPRESAQRLKLAYETLQAGDPVQALAELDLALVAGPRADADWQKKLAAASGPLRALCWLRIGELENCLSKHCCQSCIAPIEAGGRHSARRGSEEAVKVLLPLLAADPDDYDLRWMLNLAHMTLGTWPAEVPSQYLIPPERFASDYDLPRFQEVAADCGLGLSTISGGVSTEDFDRDGFLDVMVCSIGFHDQMHYFHSNGDGTFSDRTVAAGLTGLTGGLNLIHADYDNDGWTDVFVLRGAWLDQWGLIPNSLLRNRGDGTFEDVTEAAGVLSFHPTQTGQFADFNGDGWLDLVIGNETANREGTIHPAELFLSHRDGTFREVASEVGAAVIGFTKSVAVGDYDNDGRPDLFYSRRGEPNLLLHNVPDERAGGPGFRMVDVSAEAGIGGPIMSFPSWFFDFDNDGDLDLFVATNSGFGFGAQGATESIGEFIAAKPGSTFELPVLYRNLGNGKFEDATKAIGGIRAILSMGSNYGDLDNDGWLDLYLGNGAPSLAALIPNKAFRNAGGQHFQDVTTAGGLGHLQKGHGVAFADLDNDGDQDLFCELGGFFTGDFYPEALFENPGTPNHWVTLRLAGVKANRSAIGARIRVDLATPAGKRSLHLVCGTGGSFGASSLQQEIGLGDATAIEAIFIRWPGSATEQTLPGPALDHCYRIAEGSAVCEPVAMKKIHLGGG